MYSLHNNFDEIISLKGQKELQYLQQMYPGYGITWIPMGVDSDGELIVGKLAEMTNAKFSLTPDVNEAVGFTLYTREHPTGITINETSDEIKDVFNKNKPTKFVTHGWMSSGTTDTCIDIMKGFLQKYDCNVFVMNWEAIAGIPVYPIPMAKTKDVGDRLAEFINELCDAHGLDTKDIHLVGHSLGAHICGFAARGVKKGNVSRITGLDPASPGFNDIQLVEGGRLNKNDAEFVDVIHTCAGVLGISKPIGDCDVYPNGGSMPQPGCDRILQIVAACSHGRSWKLFASSLDFSVPLMAYECDSSREISKDHCNTNPIPIGDPVPLAAKGIYYLETTDEEPYAADNSDTASSNSLDKKK